MVRLHLPFGCVVRLCGSLDTTLEGACKDTICGNVTLLAWGLAQVMLVHTHKGTINVAVCVGPGSLDEETGFQLTETKDLQLLQSFL